MSVKTKQPQLTPEVLRQWRIMRDTDAGDERVHDKGQEYLPIPGGFQANWRVGGKRMWEAYLARAQFPEVIAPAVNAMSGIIHKSEWQIDVPEAMNFIYERATRAGGSLESFSRCITREILLMGRYVIGVDADVEGGEPYLVGHRCESLINWDSDFYVFDESRMVRDGFEWDAVVQYRVHQLDESGKYVQILLDENGKEISDPFYPETTKGNLDYVPIVVVGTRDVRKSVEDPPLIGAAKSAIALYRLDADYRHQLYMSGQETLVIDNGDAPEAIGPSVVIEVKSTGEMPAKVYYVSPTCSGISAHKEAIDDEWEVAAKAGAKLFDSGASVESGEARRMRQNAESATLQTIANSGAYALESALKNIAVMVGANPDEVVVTPPRNLLDSPMPAAEIKQLVDAWRLEGFSYQTLYENLQKGQFASNERTADDELQLMNNDFISGVDDL